MGKKFGLFLAVTVYFIISIGVICVNAETYNGSCGENVTYNFDAQTGELRISGSGNMENYTSESAAPWCSPAWDIFSVIIEDGVTSIGNYAFYDRYFLEKVEIPGSVKSIGDYAFYDCMLLGHVMYKDSTENWEKIDFGENSGYFEDSLCFMGGNCGEDLIWALDYDTGVLTVSGMGAMKDYKTGERAPWMNAASYITSIKIEGNVTSIGSMAFYGCAKLTDVEIGNSVESIGEKAFAYCSKLTEIEIPDSVKIIGDNAFDYCTSLNVIIIGKSVEKIGDFAFWNCSVLKSVEIPDSVKIIGDNAFDHCTKLENVIIGKSVVEIGDFAFHYCGSLKSIKIPLGVTSIGRDTFDNCTSLTEVEIPDSVTIIGMSAFEKCNSLESVKIPGSVKSIDEGAFRNCSKLTEIEIPDSVTSIGKTAFYKTGYYDDADNWDEGVLYMSGCLISADEAINGEYEIKTGTRMIAGGAFMYCSDLTGMTIPVSVMSIGEDAFAFCEALTKAVYKGSKEEWENVVVDSYNGYLTDIIVFAGDEVSVHAVLDEDALTVVLENVAEGSIIIAVVKQGGVTKAYTRKYEGRDVPFNIEAGVDSVKVLVWGSIATMEPVCEATVVK